MKKISTIFWQIVVVLIGVGALSFMLWEPQLEGRNAQATFFQIYFHDVFLAYVYLASIIFFVALYQAFKALGYARNSQGWSPEILRSVRTIKYCAVALVGFAMIGEIILIFNESDDRAGGVFMGVLVISVSVVVALVAAKLERLGRNTAKLKSK